MNDTNIMSGSVNLGEDLDRRTSKMEEFCSSLVISDDSDYAQADKAASEIAALKKGAREYWKDAKAKAYAAWKEICLKEDQMITPLERALKSLTGTMAGFRQEREKAELKKQEAAQAQHREDQEYEAFKLAEEGYAPEAIEAVMEQAAESNVQVAPSQSELRGKTSFAVSYEVSIVPGEEHNIPAELLIPTTAGHIKAVLAKAKKKAMLTGGKPIPGIKIVQTQSARTRSS
jgi:hypothetical protein